MNNEKLRGIRHFISAFGWSMDGLKVGIRDEAAVRQEIALNFLQGLLLWWFPCALHFKCLLVLCGGMTLALELVNTAIEAVVDLVSPGRHPLAKKAKDCGSAAVLVALVVWGLIFALVCWLTFVGGK